MSILSDLLFSLRSMRKNAGFTIVAIMVLALGIGANSSVLTLVNSVLWTQLPYCDADYLATVWSHRTDRDKAPLSIADYQDFREQGIVLKDLAVFAPWGANLISDGDPERLNGVRTTSNIFELLGVQASRGRLLQPSDDAPDHGKVAVISDGLWKRRFGGEESVVGRSIVLNGESYLIAGVWPAAFFFPI